MLAGTQLEGFRIVRRLGEGGMGVVYEAIDTRRDVRVALKTIRTMSADALARFKREFRLLQDVHHPNLVALGELIVQHDACFFTMELVHGVDFVTWVRPPRPRSEPVAPDAPAPPAFDVARLRDAVLQLVSGLDAMHTADLMHRDMKPENVRVTSEGRVVLLDFGLVQDAASRQMSSATNIAGTPAYMAPEQATSGAIGPATN